MAVTIYITNCVGGFLFPYFIQHLSFIDFLMIIILIKVVITHCGCDLHSVITGDIRHLFVCFMAIYWNLLSSLEKWLFKSSAHIFLILICMNCLCILEINPSSVLYLQIVFPFWGLSFVLFMISSASFIRIFSL